MAQIFPRGSNTLARVGLVLLVAAPILLVSYLLLLARSDYVTGEERTVEQPVPFSHAHHVAEIGIDCRYCHTGVETSDYAGIPPTRTCMTCHSQLWTEAEMLAPVRRSLVTGERLRWKPVNHLPDYVYFSHQAHVGNGVACTTCHGPVGEMKLTRQAAPLSMGWCLDCHRDPAPNLSPPEARFDPLDAPTAATMAAGEALMAYYDIHPQGLTDCSRCHR